MKNKGKELITNIYKILNEYSDESNYLSIKNIQDKLLEKGISADRKTIGSYLDYLEESGVDIICQRSVQNRYHIGSRQFQIPELKLMIDAIKSARFISNNRADQIIEKLLDTVSTYERKDLNRKIILLNKTSIDYPQILNSIDSINDAIINSSNISFTYIDYDISKKEYCRNQNEEYTISPYALIWRDDQYYLLGYSFKHEKDRVYRVDRMRNVIKIYGEYVKLENTGELNDIVQCATNMFLGDIVDVTLKCHASVMKHIIDKFGIDVKVQQISGEEFYAYVKTSLTVTLYSWIFNFSGKISIVSPKEGINEFKLMIENNSRWLKK